MYDERIDSEWVSLKQIQKLILSIGRIDDIVPLDVRMSIALLTGPGLDRHGGNGILW
jgi:hypothetical protein